VRRLTFSGYLRADVARLSGESTAALLRLAQLSKKEPRLAEPLALWAVKSGRATQLSRLLSSDSHLVSELTLLDSLEQQGRLEAALDSGDSRLRPEYVKAWRSFVVRRDAPDRDASLKLLARERALELERRKGVTRYRMAKDLGLNPGNLHAFLAQGNASKLSLARAYQLVEYLDAA